MIKLIFPFRRHTHEKLLFILWQCTWGLPATLVGLGLFIFTPKDSRKNSQLIRVHEYGHCIQNLLLGPLMLFVGVISVTWANHPYFIKLRRGKGLPYTACFVEAWASSWGEKVTGEKAIWQ